MKDQKTLIWIKMKVQVIKLSWTLFIDALFSWNMIYRSFSIFDCYNRPKKKNEQFIQHHCWFISIDYRTPLPIGHWHSCPKFLSLSEFLLRYLRCAETVFWINFRDDVNLQTIIMREFPIESWIRKKTNARLSQYHKNTFNLHI